MPSSDEFSYPVQNLMDAETGYRPPGRGGGTPAERRRNAALRLRARIFRTLRRFFEANGYLEVETPCRIPAPAPEVHVDAPPAGDWFLQASPELCMKRLLASGLRRIFQVCHCFRTGERGARHLPEMTMLEWYAVGNDYRHLMDECEQLLRAVARELGRGDQIVYQGNEVSLANGWPRLTVEEAFDRYAPVSAAQALREGRFDEIMGLVIEPQLGRTQPVFLCDYPAACAALARLKPDNPAVAERFELYVAGLELCNGFTELVDVAEQRQRFEEALWQRRKLGKRAYPMPESFLADLARMPAAAGNALGLDRLVMLFADAATIDQVVAFTPETL